MMRYGIDEYTVTGTFDVLTQTGNALAAACMISVVAAFVFAVCAFDTPKRVRSIVYAAIAAVLAVTAVTSGVLSAGSDYVQEATEERSYLVATGIPVWTDTVRSDGRIDELLIRLDSAQEWLLEFHGPDIDRLIGRTDAIEVQCSAVSDERLRCQADITGPQAKRFWFIQENERTWGEPTVTPYRR